MKKETLLKLSMMIFLGGGGGEQRGGTNQKNHPVCLVLCTKGKNINTQSGPRLQRAFNYSQEPNLRCFVAGPVLSRVTLTRGGGSQKVTNDDEGEGGVTIPPKIDDVIYEQPLTMNNTSITVVGGTQKQ